MEATASSGSRWSRLWIVGIALALVGGVLVVIGALQTTDSGGGNQPCPAGTTLTAKFEYDNGRYQLSGGSGGTVTISGNADGGTFTSTVPISAVIVKGGPASVVATYDPPVTSGTFSNAGLPLVGSGNIPDISNIQFCAPTAPPPTTEVTPTTDDVTPTTDESTPTTDEVTPTTDDVPPTTDEVTPTTDDVPPTTDEVTPTTDDVTTTTDEQATTTTEPAATTTEPTTTTTEPTTTTSTPAPTTTIDSGVSPATPSTSIVMTPDGELARTGAPSAVMITIGGLLLLAGIMLIVVGRRGGRSAEL